MQKHWIGKSTGAEVTFKVKDSDIKELEDKGYKIVDRKNSLYVILKYEANSIDF